MANRPVFVVDNWDFLVKKVNTDFKWHPGFSLKQKRKNIEAIHKSFKENIRQEKKILEISTKSKSKLGVSLSAFNLLLKIEDKKNTIETIFQASKAFENGGPYKDLLKKSSKEAKTDERLRISGKLKHFQFKNKKWPLEPKTFFYDWLYLNALKQNLNKTKEIINYDAFTDIEFNPKKSINCQARSAALFVSLYKKDLLEEALTSPQSYKKIVASKQKEPTQLKLF